MKSETDEILLAADVLVREKARLARDGAARRKLSDQLLPGLPVDADVPPTRVPTPAVGSLVDRLVREITYVKEPFFDAVCDQWKTLCPDLPARPGRYQNGRLYLYVKTSGILFGLRAKLPRLRKLFASLPHAPRRLSVNLEIHAERP